MLNLILIIGFYLLVSGLRPFYCPVELRFCVRSYSDISVRFSPIFAEIKNRTGYDLRELENVDGKFLTQDGTDILELYKIGVINSKNIPEEYKGMVFELYSGKLIELAKKGFENIEDLNLSIDYKNGSFYDLGQSENFGTGKTKWIDELKASKSQTDPSCNKSVFLGTDCITSKFVKIFFQYVKISP